MVEAGLKQTTALGKSPRVDGMRQKDLVAAQLSARPLPKTSLEIAKVTLTQRPKQQFVVESTAGRFNEYISSHLGLIRPVMDQVNAQVAKNLPPPLAEKVREQLTRSSELKLPFWFNQPFDIVIRELLVNAVEATWKNQNTDPCIHVALIHRDDKLVIEITDNGVGIPTEARSKIYQHGWTSKKLGESAQVGRGLHYSKKFVEEIMGGTLEVCDRSSLGHDSSGAIARIELPLKLDS